MSDANARPIPAGKTNASLDAKGKTNASLDAKGKTNASLDAKAQTNVSANARASARPARHIDVDGIDHVNISVRDLERSIDFYSRVFGFDVVEDARDRQRPYVIMSAAGQAFLAIHEYASAAPPRVPFLNHWGFVVGDVDEARRKVSEHGVTIAESDAELGDIYGWPKSRSLYVFDPDGHEIELVEVWGGGLGAG